MMRSEGVKRPLEELLAAQPLRGELVVHTADPKAYAILTRPWLAPTAASFRQQPAPRSRTAPATGLETASTHRSAAMPEECSTQ